MATPLVLTDRATFPTMIGRFGDAARRWCAANAFTGESGHFIALPGDDGAPRAMLAGCDWRDPVFALASLPQRLPEADYVIDLDGHRNATDGSDGGRLVFDGADLALGWALGAYRFTRYKNAKRAPARLVVEAEVEARIAPFVTAICQVRDLINTPTEDMGPAELCTALRTLAERHSANYREWIGDELLTANFPTIHAVGRASHRAPRLAELSAGRADAPHLVLVGKGVCFDSGGLDIKSSDGMRWMKKDMGGAAHAIGLASLILDAKLPLRLSVLIPAVENSIGGNAFRPGEVITTRAGLTVEVDNTDAEGRLVLCDALAYAAESRPDLILDFATLTGAARVALGPDLPALFCNRDDIAQGLLDASSRVRDPLWRMPLWRPYLPMLESHVADLANAGPSRHAGAVTAALYLERFVPDAQSWAHLDVYSWNDSDKPGHPRGGEAQGLRAYFDFIARRYTNAA